MTILISPAVVFCVTPVVYSEPLLCVPSEVVENLKGWPVGYEKSYVLPFLSSNVFCCTPSIVNLLPEPVFVTVTS